MDFLLPLDAKPHSQRSVDLTLKLFDLADRSVVLLHVIEEPDPAMLLADRTGHLEETYALASISSAKDLLEIVAQRLKPGRGRVDIRIEKGDPATVIKSVALAERAACIVTVPGRHPPQEIMLKRTISSQLVGMDFNGTLILARELEKMQEQPQAAFLVDGSDGSVEAVKRLVPLLLPEVPLSLVALPYGYAPSGQSLELVSSPPAESLRRAYEHGDPTAAVEAAAAWLDGSGRQYGKFVLTTAFDEWFAQFTAEGRSGLLVIARRREDILHRPIGGSQAEKIFLSAPWSTALYCSKIKP